ncbi:Nucleic acid-binding, OB-fold protein [Hirsutella rhossiliensis]|uniref:Nucleic acid-binding, OB-fold protein n=1 Tax=Hirsutella rhossiliensis TaxID=111463 RepID=A0A9P8SDM9_9HYPO|nr:Nucleic acid-binding, OB-fold protein [Hirsutella rhossiliensis]KAH0958771.1 Nucleic acid-binding, OB-fold protein [Hirsutella rhossiliensis]
MSTPKVILMAGAPPPSALDDMSSCTVTRFDEPFHTLLRLPNDSFSSDADGDIPSQPTHVAWRSIPLARSLTMLSQRHDALDASLHASPDLFTTADVSDPLLSRDDTSAEDAWTQFCEHSLAQHHPSSQPLDDSVAVDDETALSANLSSVMPADPVPLHLSDLEDVPRAKRIVALQPQTVSLNLIVGVISIAQPRSVTTRWGQRLSLVELLVGDNSATGFAVTFWLSASQAEESSVVRLRRQDVVLMENVALHVFRGKVYGQSLRRGLTRVNLLWRSDGTGHYSTRRLDRENAAKHPQQEKARLVKDWVLHFVGRDPVSTTRKPRKSWDNPPDDTQ